MNDMNDMNELKTTQDIVMEILKASTKARNSDNYLFYAVYATVGEKHGIDIDKMTVPTFFLHMKEYGFPAPETIRRTRQKIQASHSELASCDEVSAMRIVKEDTFRNYAMGHLV